MSSTYQQAGIKTEESAVRGFALSMPSDASRRLASGWLWLGIASLVGAGLFAILLVLSRTPYVQDFFPWVDFFIPLLWCMSIYPCCCGSWHSPVCCGA